MCWEWMLQLIFETLFTCMPSCISVHIGFVNYTIFNNICIQSLPDPAIFRLNFQDSYFQWFQRNGLHALAKSWKKTLPLSMTELLQRMLKCDSEQRPNVDMCDLEDFFWDDFGCVKREALLISWWQSEKLSDMNTISWLGLIHRTNSMTSTCTRVSDDECGTMEASLKFGNGYYFLKSTFLAGRILEIPFVQKRSILAPVARLNLPKYTTALGSLGNFNQDMQGHVDKALLSSP